VAYYAVPFDVVTRTLVIPTAIAAVLFPAFATSYVHDPVRTSTLFMRGSKYVFLVLFPITLVTVTIAAPGLRLWLGTGFANQSAPVLQWLAIGVLFSGLAQVPFALIQGVGRADLTAKIHLVEAPVYLPIMWWMILRFGIGGAAVAWTVRVLADMVILFAVSHRILGLGPALFMRMGVTLAAAGASLAIAFLLADRLAGAAFLVLVLVSFALWSWFFLLAVDERDLAWRRLGAGFAGRIGWLSSRRS
jgi:O-antigen/teichoic acid export membrane protein